MKKSALLFIMFFIAGRLLAEDGYRLWLRYDKIDDPVLLQQYRKQINSIYFDVYFNKPSPTFEIAKKELSGGLQGLFDKKINEGKDFSSYQLIINKRRSEIVQTIDFGSEKLGSEGFKIISLKRIHDKSGGDINNVIVITANTDAGILYGVFQFLRLLQTHQPISNLHIISIPKIQNRILNHWDNLNRTVERGYAGFSIWDWHKLPDYIDQRYIDYARANASIGINGTVLTNVNANALVLTKIYLEKVAALANIFRPYGIKVYLTARFSAPIEIGGLKTADPLNTEVQEWWKKKVNEIYHYIPDFGGFLVKANSEGQPGPQNYERTHADGANMLADAVAPHRGIVMWRAFVYSNETPDDRFKQAYNEFKPLDGQFRKNVLIQVKNGPIDFQPREPFHPLFGAMPKTPLMMEFQITQEYLGQATNLVYLPTMFKEVLDADTYAKGKGSFVSKVIDGSLDDHSISCIAGVANIGNDRNWTGHPFAQANWYAFGRLAWDHALTPGQIADEWIRQTFANNQEFINVTKQIMLSSREILVNYMTPLGLNHIMGTGHHYGPAPWVNNAGRADWNPVYYHKADSIGIGFDRTITGSNALSQYAPELSNQWNDLNNCPDEYLLWFHHVNWNYKMSDRPSGGRSGRTLWEELCYKYYSGVDSIRAMQKQWNKLEKYIDKARFEQVKMLLGIHVKEAVWWRNACLLYFQTFSKKPIPANYEKPDHALEYYKELKFPYAPGN